VERLPPHLTQVQQQGQRINQLRDLGWWKQASLEELEESARIAWELYRAGLK